MVGPAILSLIYLRWWRPIYTFSNSYMRQMDHKKKIFCLYLSSSLFLSHLSYLYHTSCSLSFYLLFYHLLLPRYSYHPWSLYFPSTNPPLGYHYLWRYYCYPLYYSYLTYLYLFYKWNISYWSMNLYRTFIENIACKIHKMLC